MKFHKAPFILLSLFGFALMALSLSAHVQAEPTVVTCPGETIEDKTYDLNLTLDPEAKAEATVGVTENGNWSVAGIQSFDRTQSLGGGYTVLDQPTPFGSHTGKQEIDSVTVESKKKGFTLKLTDKKYYFSSEHFEIKVLGTSLPHNRLIFSGCKIR